MPAPHRCAALALALALGAPAAAAECGAAAARSDARCFSTLQSATMDALAHDRPLWLPAHNVNGSYHLTRPWVIDYAARASTGFQLISDGAVIDGSALRQGPALAITCSGGTPARPKGCFYFHQQGTLFVNLHAAGFAVMFGQPDLADAHNSAKLDHLIVNNGDAANNAGAVMLGYVLNSDLFLVADSAGGVGLDLRQVQFSRVGGAFSAGHGAALRIEGGYSFADTFAGLDLEASPVCLAIGAPDAGNNTFVSPYFDCPTAVMATAGHANLLLNPIYAGLVRSRGAALAAPGQDLRNASRGAAAATGIVSLP